MGICAFIFSDEGADMDFLLIANEGELSQLVPKVVLKAKLRNAIETFVSCYFQPIGTLCRIFFKKYINYI